jgi:predicted nucleic acid-binding protein
VTITRHGQPVAVLVRPDILQRRRAEVVLDDAGRIHDLLTEAAATPLPEVLGKPLRDGSTDEVRLLAGLLARLDLRPTDRATAELATSLATRYRLRAADAIHLATAVAIGADRFITSNKRDFPGTMTEIAVTYPADLPDGTS